MLKLKIGLGLICLGTVLTFTFIGLFMDNEDSVDNIEGCILLGSGIVFLITGIVLYMRNKDSDEN